MRKTPIQEIYAFRVGSAMEIKMIYLQQLGRLMNRLLLCWKKVCLLER
jgi:hypothetical protein